MLRNVYKVILKLLKAKSIESWMNSNNKLKTTKHSNKWKKQSIKKIRKWTETFGSSKWEQDKSVSKPKKYKKGSLPLALLPTWLSLTPPTSTTPMAALAQWTQKEKWCVWALYLTPTTWTSQSITNSKTISLSTLIPWKTLREPNLRPTTQSKASSWPETP